MNLAIRPRLAGIPGHRRFKWLTVVLWVAVLAAIGPAADKIWDSTDDDATAWLPASAESTAVAAAQDGFPAGDVKPAVVVFARESGLTPSDREAVAVYRASLAAAVPEARDARVTDSADGKALTLGVPLRAATAGDAVKVIRAGADRAVPEGLVVKTTGPAAASADTGDAFDGLDSTLLWVSVLVVGFLLLLTYRSPVLWLLPLIAVAVGSRLASAVVYLLIEHAGLVVNSQNAGVLTVLVFGIGTDYALLLISRYREELRVHEDRHRALAVALRRSAPAIFASAATVVAGLLCLVFADLAPDSGLGPVGAIGVGCAVLAMTTLLPALLAIFGRWVFWPLVPRPGGRSAAAEPAGVWARVAAVVARRPKTAGLATALGLVVLALAGTGMHVGLGKADSFTTTPESLAGQQILARHFPAGSSDPAIVLSTRDSAAAVAAAAGAVEGVGSVGKPAFSADGTLARTPVQLTDAPDSAAAADTVQRLRDAVHRVPGADAKVGGTTAAAFDTDRASAHDRLLVMPLVLLVVLLVLILLLRSLVAPLLLVATVVLSFGSALGAGWLLFRYVFGFAGVDQNLILLGFLFLVAVGVDYNIFLVSRIREEAGPHGHAAGVRRGLAVTGGVITSAGLVLAATFSVLTVLPLVATVELGVLVGVGILIDTLVVRSLLVPALALTAGPRFWWPDRRPAKPVVVAGEPEEVPEPVAAGGRG
ncbi:MMPL family transporter [Amycolatopsis sp. NPDC021455]|uniref:MMPL family transporter n=1 Tax=Amycolatopsis sp. NPDC021455 TaxID=3154901 RepID=UPI0033EEBBE3